MNYKALTKIFILAVVLIASVFDVYVFVKGGTEATISWTIFDWSHKHPVVAFAAGFLCGHLFWQMKGLKKLKEAKE